jgi:3-hydroxyisobutyrate dehydrogenase
LNPELKTGVIGLGAMGAPMSPGKAAALAQETGAHHAATPADLAGRCDVILTCVSADADLESVVEQAQEGMISGSVLLDISTVSPGVTMRIAQGLEERGVGLVDAPVSGGVEGAIKGQLSAMVGGDLANFSRVLPVLETFSASIHHMGPVGSGQATKAVNQVVVGGVAEAVCEALALSEKLNLPSERLLTVLSAGAADSWFLRHRGATMLEDSFEKGFKLSLLLKDLLIVRDLARDLDISVPTVEAAIGDYTALVAAGEGDNDISGLIRRKRMQKAAEAGI